MAKRITKISIYNKETGWSTPVPIGAQASNIMGTVSVGHGGTGATSYTTNAVLLGNGSNAIKTSGAVGNSTTPVYINSNGGISTCVGEASADQISAMLSSLGL